jgi:hypothetical protein
VITAEIRGVEADPGPFTKSPITRIAKAHCGLVAAPCVAIRSGVSKVMTPYPELIPSCAIAPSCSKQQYAQRMLKRTVVASSAAKWGVLPVVVGWREVLAVSSATSRVC